ncbi:MAG: hypothetical protein EBR79_04255 [Proteobacteria bacterium]|nr:hypothetical protein [Pseudomonadota bacterium]NBX86067.1 hypothetical protein [Pseudomonadota bacterium]
MDIRITAYRPSTATTIQRSNAPQNTQPFQPVSPISPLQQQPNQQQNVNGSTRTATNTGGGYTDSTRGTLVNILA